MKWTKQVIRVTQAPTRRAPPAPPAETWTARSGPLSVTVKAKGDGRWSWEIVKDGATSPTATGNSQSLNTAKRTAENFVQRAGYD